METGTTLENGYTLKTTFWNDFSIAEKFGTRAIRETYERAFKEWKSNIEYFTELSLVLNWKAWHFQKTNPTFAELYCELWEDCDLWAGNNLKGADARYYYEVTD